MPRRRLRALVPLLAVLAATVLAASAAPAAAGGGCHRPPSEGRGATLTLTEACFSPTVLRAAPGSELTIVNRDQLDHPLGQPGGSWGWDGAVGDRTTVRLGEDGVYPFYCYVHPSMVAVVVVGDGRGAAAPLAEVAAPAAPQAAGQAAQALPAGPAAQAFPTAWLVVVALAALGGAVAGTRLATRPRSG
jgi:plastocyanin